MKNLDTDRKRGRWLAWKWAALASLCLAGTLFALDETFEADTDGDGWTDAEEIIAGTDPLDSADPWDSDGDGIPDFLEFENGTDPLDPNDPPRDALANAAGKISSENRSLSDLSFPMIPDLEYTVVQAFPNPEAYHGSPIQFCYATGENGWSAVSGSEIEIWTSHGVFELCARGSYGVQFYIESPSKGTYLISWSHRARVDGNGNASPRAYFVKVFSGTNLISSQEYFAPVLGASEASEVKVYAVQITQEQANQGIRIAFDPSSHSGQTGALIGTDIRLGLLNFEPIISEGGPDLVNPCGIEIFKSAKYKVKVEPPHFKDSHLIWKIDSGNVSFKENAYGREVTVQADGLGAFKLSLDIDGFSEKPSITGEVFNPTTTPLYFYVVKDGTGNTNWTTEKLCGFAENLNKVYKQLAMNFTIGGVYEINDAHYLNIADEEKLFSLQGMNHKLDGLEVYCVESLWGDKVGVSILGGEEAGITLSNSASYVDLAHEIGHACGVRDIYVGKLVGTIRYGITDSVKREWLPGDWSGGPLHGCYPSNLTQASLIRRLLMNGEKGESSLDIPCGPVHGVDERDDELMIDISKTGWLIDGPCRL